MHAWTPPDSAGDRAAREVEWLRRAGQLSFRALREREPDVLLAHACADTLGWLDATVVDAYAVDAGGRDRLVERAGDATALSGDVATLAGELTLRAARTGRSLISNHPDLHADLRPAAERLAGDGTIVHAIRLAAHGTVFGVLCCVWVGVPRPSYDRRAGFYLYVENVALALAAAAERARLEGEVADIRRVAFVDPLTGLPNQHALDQELRRFGDDDAVGVIVLDFDGMKDANTAFGNDFARGGNVLILAVAEALRAFADPGWFVARMHTAGDEFCLLVPGVDADAATLLAAELERRLDALEVPPTHRPLYRGASVGAAGRRPQERMSQVLGRAGEAMFERKLGRRRPAAS
jgi:diguanylate cyclase (GGDEF)-like protein